MPRVLNETKGTVVAEQARVADSLWSRLLGLMGRGSLPEGQGLLLRPSNSIHTAFMRFAIDVVFLDRQLRVVKVVPAMRPFRVALAFGGAHSALELPARAASQARVEPGDQLVMTDGQ
ncbi:MAG TPA: DUF192 domain-containing protein [Dehalococcoidia bacterium]|nr:DUF192 domain-containing protein [Dehalococcoidia bacterium]